ncbi:MAG: type II secretion system protein, partial [Candidatus Gastranaerophilales bacterium]|nr:type II secretion system protein [Candidatus Gastranaerophilales bacterium]
MKKNAFTFAEVLLVMTIVAIIAVLTFKVQKSQNDYLNKYMYYSAFTNLKDGVGELVAKGNDSGAKE